jgi:hypothetical protein
MRWDNLFDDLESQLEQGLSAEEVDLRAEEERLRLGRLTVRDRILSIRESYDKRADYAIRLVLTSGDLVDVRPVTIGRDWISGDIRDETPRRRQCIVPIASIAGIALHKEQVRRSLNDSQRETGESLAARLGLPFVLRDLCRRRVDVEIATPAAPVTGTIDRVGKDHVDVAVHEADTPRRDTEVSGYRLVPFVQIVIVRL